MKGILTALLFSMSLHTASGQATSTETITIKTSIHCDHCLQCGSCGQNINDRIREHNKGIRKVRINAGEDTITVTYKADKTNPDEIRKAVAAAGYDADNIKASTDGFAKLDDCCKP